MLTLTKNHTIAQHALVSILNQRQHVEALKRQYEDARVTLQALEEQVIASLEDGYKVAPGQRTATIKTIEKRIVPWKDAFITRLGKAMADKVQVEAEPTTYKKLEIQ